MTSPRLRTLLRQAKKVADNGKRDAALALYKQIVDEAPQSEEAWLGVAELTLEKSDKESAYQQVLALNEENQEAQLGLARLRGEVPPEPQVTEMDEVAPVETTQAGSTEAETGPEALAQSTIEQEQETAAAPAPPTLQPAHDPAQATLQDKADDNVVDTEALFCYRHPDRSTSLRCYSCGKPICINCAIHTPVGYRCPTCIREAESVFFNSKATDYIIAPAVSLPMSLLAGFILMQFGGGGIFLILIVFFLSGVVGGFIGRITKAAVGRRRGRYLPHIVAFIVALGGVFAALPALLTLLVGSAGGIFGLIVPGVYAFVASSAAFYQMK